VLDLQEAKDAQVTEIAALKKKVAKLNKWRKSRSRGLRRLKKLGSGRRGMTNDDEMFRVDNLAGEEVVIETTTSVKDSAALTTDVTKNEVTMSQALAALKSTKPKVMVQEQEKSTTITAAATTVTTPDKGKAKMIEPEVPTKKKDQTRIDEDTKRAAEHLEYDISKKQKVDENVEPIIDDSEELKKCMKIVPNDGDEVLIKATPLSSRSLTIIDYQNHKEGKKNYFKIIIAYDRFKKEKPMDDMDNLIFRTLKTIFEHHVEDTIWKYQQGLAKVKNWKLFESYGEDASKHGGKIEAIDADEKITLVDVESQEEIAQRLHDEEVQKATARDKQEKDDIERAQVLQKQYDDKKENIDWNAVAEQVQERHLHNMRKYQSLKKKPVSIAQARKNMIIYLKNMAGYKMEHFRGMTYDKVRPIFEREYKKVQNLFKPDKDVEEPKKKRVANETLLQESFKKLRAAKVSGSESTQEILSNDSKEMSEEDVQNIVGGITKAYQSFEDMLKGFDKEDLVTLWNLVKEKFSLAVPSVNKEKALWVELKRLFEPDADGVLWKLQRYMHALLTWKLYTNYGVHRVSSTRGHGIFMLTEKDYPLSNRVMILMLSGKLQVEEDNEMARDLVMMIFMEANKPKRAEVWIHPPSDQDA
nr:hypothetical protein [Tanacetum cinerariifolium]